MHFSSWWHLVRISLSRSFFFSVEPRGRFWVLRLYVAQDCVEAGRVVAVPLHTRHSGSMYFPIRKVSRKKVIEIGRIHSFRLLSPPGAPFLSGRGANK